MAEYVLKNEKLQLTVSEHGAEIHSIVRNSDGREMMWQADPAFWGRTSPVLFPLVGNYRDKTSYYDGKAYQMSQHGFARDMDFSMQEAGLENGSSAGRQEKSRQEESRQEKSRQEESRQEESRQEESRQEKSRQEESRQEEKGQRESGKEESGASGNELWFTLTDSEATHEKYPFAFRLKIGYILKEDTVTVCWNVQNTDTRKMYFSIGGHPAFGCDLNHSYLTFEKDEQTVEGVLTCNVIEGDGSGCLSDRQKSLALSEGSLAMSDELFAEDALIVEDRQADAVTLLDADKKQLLTVRFDAPLFGIWSPVGKHAPFVCIEPWYGRCDRVDFGQKLEEREYGNALEPGEEFAVSYQIQIYDCEG